LQHSRANEIAKRGYAVLVHDAFPFASRNALISHKLTRIGSVCPALSSRDVACIQINGAAYLLAPNEKATNNTAYWVLQLPKEIVPDHSPVFTSEFTKLLETLSTRVKPDE
jgi:hypothetical protein